MDAACPPLPFHTLQVLMATSPFSLLCYQFFPGAPLLSDVLLPLYLLIFHFATGQSQLEMSCHFFSLEDTPFSSEHGNITAFPPLVTPYQFKLVSRGNQQLLPIRPMGAAKQPLFVAFLPPGNATMEQFTFSKCKSGSYLRFSWYCLEHGRFKSAHKVKTT